MLGTTKPVQGVDRHSHQPPGPALLGFTDQDHLRVAGGKSLAKLCQPRRRAYPERSEELSHGRRCDRRKPPGDLAQRELLDEAGFKQRCHFRKAAATVTVEETGQHREDYTAPLPSQALDSPYEQQLVLAGHPHQAPAKPMA